MPRHPASSFDFSKYPVWGDHPNLEGCGAGELALNGRYPGFELPEYAVLPTRSDWEIPVRLEPNDYGHHLPSGLALAHYYGRPLSFGKLSGAAELAAHVALVGPAVLNLEWHRAFDRPRKHPFGRGRRQSYFVGEGPLGGSRGVHSVVARSYRRTRSGEEYLRLQNSWGHDYPLVWVPLSTLRTLFARGEAAALAVAP